MRKELFFLGLVSSLTFAASGCGPITLPNDGGHDGAPDMATGTGGSGGAGHDECQRDSDCPTIMCINAPCPVSVCVMGNDGFHHCRERQEPALETCPDARDPFCCTADAQCTEHPHGMCVPIRYATCSGARRIGNRCIYDRCQGDADCTAMPNGVCTGEFPRRCAYGPCRKNADCTARPGGTCVLASVSQPCVSDAVFCRYANDPCRSDGDCKEAVCVPNANGQGTACKIQEADPP